MQDDPEKKEKKPCAFLNFFQRVAKSLTEAEKQINDYKKKTNNFPPRRFF